ncbi:hypothetical protein BJX62DRAFT_250312 [Aspergillus germanicus]
MRLNLTVALSLPPFAQRVFAMTPNVASNTAFTLLQQLFLDLRVQDVLDNNTAMILVEPWATKYVESLRDKRYGDANWARYHIAGDLGEGLIDDGGSGNMTVLQAIEDDARDYRVNDEDLYRDALSLYSQTSNEDTHATDVLALLRRIGAEQHVPKAAEEPSFDGNRTFGISCSRNNEAYENACGYLVRYMGNSRALIGDRRDVYSYGNCYLGVGPYKGPGTDVSEWTAEAVARLIMQECDYVPPCCRYKVVSGWSPKNSGHRKIFLSGKPGGCSS